MCIRDSRRPVRCGPWTPAGATPKAPPRRPKTDQPIDISPSSDSSSQPTSLGLDQLAPLPTQKKRSSLGDPNPGSSKHQRSVGQPAERRRSSGSSVAVAAAVFQGASTPTPKEPVARRGPAPGRARRTGWAPKLDGVIEGCFFIKAWF
eukprot:973805-Pyramimonas_sp.AAC.1